MDSNNALPHRGFPFLATMPATAGGMAGAARLCFFPLPKTGLPIR